MSATETAPQTEQAPRQRRVVRGGTVAVWAERSALPVAWAALIIIYSILAPSGTFDTWSNVTSILSSQAVLFTLALAALMPSFVGDFDLSLGGIMGLTGMVVGVLNSQDGVNIVLACLVGMAVAVLAGAVNAFFVVTCDTNPLIITLGSGSVFIGLIYMMGSGNTITIASSGVTKWTYSTTWLNIPAEFYYGLGLMLIIWYVSSHTPLGLRALFVGQSRDVARLSGIRADRLRWGGFVLGAVIAGIAGLMFIGTTGSVDPTATGTYLLPAYAAVFLGATTIKPGRFNAVGVLVAVFFLATGVNGLQILGEPNTVQDMFYGGALVVAVTLSRLLRRQA